MKNMIYATLGFASVLALGAYVFVNETSNVSSTSNPPAIVGQLTVQTEAPSIEVKTLSTTQYSVANTFSDVSNDAWYTQYIQRAYDNGLVSGVSDGTFNPEGELNFGAFSVMIANAYHGTELTDNKYIYSDTGNWADPYTNTIKELYGTNSDYQSILNGFNGDTALTRYNASALIGMLLKTEGLSNSDLSAVANKFSDIGDLGVVEKGLLGVTSQFNVMNGTDGTQFSGTSNLNRAQACVIMCALLDLSDQGKLSFDKIDNNKAPSQEAIDKKAELNTPVVTTPSTSTTTDSSWGGGTKGEVSKETYDHILDLIENGGFLEDNETKFG